MRASIGSKAFKTMLIVLRVMVRPMAGRLAMATTIYYRVDLRLYAMGKVRLFPRSFYRLLTILCNWIASVNTVDHCRLRSRNLQRGVNWLIHRIPTDIRFA